MGVEYSESRRRVNEEGDYLPRRNHQEELFDGIEHSRVSSRHRSMDMKKFQREEKDHSDNDRERLKGRDGFKQRESESQNLENDRVSSREKSRERRREDRDVPVKDKSTDKAKYNDYEREKIREKGREKDKERKSHRKERDHGRERESEKNVEWGREKDKIKEKSKDRDKERHKENNWVKAKEREDRRQKEYEKDRNEALPEIDTGIERVRARDRDDNKKDQDRERPRDKDKVASKSRDAGRDWQTSLDGDDKVASKVRKSYDDEASNIQRVQAEVASDEIHSSDIVERITKMKDDRLKKKPTGDSETLSWVNKSRRLEERKKAEKEQALQLSRMFEEQDNADQEGNEDDYEDKHTAEYLAGVKVLHGLDKVVEGGAVVLTLKDQNILADGAINEEIDMLENVEIGEQKRRDEAYSAAKMKTGIYVDKFNDEPGSEKRILPQYDDTVKDEGITLDERGRFSGEAEKKLEELRRKIYGVPGNNKYEDLSFSWKNSSDYYTQEEMLQFKKSKKKKSLRKKEKLDIDALEADAIASGLGVGDLGSRNDGKREAILKEKENFEAEKRRNAYQSAYAKADEASKALRLNQTHTVQFEDEKSVFGNANDDDDDDDLSKSLERARKLVFQKQDVGGPKAVALLASVICKDQNKNDPSSTPGDDTQENKLIFTEMDEFMWGLQHDQGTEKADNNGDVFMEEDIAAIVSGENNEKGGWKEVNENGKNEGSSMNEARVEDNVAADEIIREPELGKGLCGALHLLKERGALKDSVDWGGRNMDKKKSKLVGLDHIDGTKEINIERTDAFGRILTPKEAFRVISHKFHGKGPGKMNQEKRLKQYNEELKLKQMRNSDTPSLSVERMRESQARLGTPYLLLSGNVRHGQSSDPQMIEKDLPGSLTPMLGDRKVEHFLGIHRK